MNKNFVIFSIASREYEACTKEICAIRINTSIEAVKEEVSILNSKIITDDFTEYYFDFVEMPVEGYSFISIPMNDHEIQKNSFKNYLNIDLIKHRKDIFNADKIPGVDFKDFILNDLSYQFKLLSHEEMSEYYDEIIKKDFMKLVLD